MEEDPLFGAYEQRLLVFLEKDSYDGFNQVMLDPVQFKRVSDACIKSTRPDSSLKEGYDMATIALSEDVYAPGLFDGLNSINEEPEDE